jgi:hypothetical protein
VNAETVTHPGGDPGFVQGDPEPHIPGQRLVDDACVLGEAFAGLPVRPAAPILERLGQVPVVEGQHGFDGAASETFDQPPVEINTLLVDVARTIGLYAGPGYGEAVGPETELGHQVEVFVQPVVMVAGDVARIAVVDFARSVAEGVPDRSPAAVLVDSPFDLVGGRRRSPQETLGKSHALISLSLVGGRLSAGRPPQSHAIDQRPVHDGGV